MTEILLSTLALSMAINYAMFLVAFWRQSDKLTDISYAVSFIVLAAYAFSRSSGDTQYNLLALGMVVLWACRIGGFLLYRVIKNGKDARFDGMRNNFWAFGKFWTGQGLTVWLISLPILLVLTNETTWHTFSLIGLGIWLVGLTIESIADYQKYNFSTNPANKGKWIEQGIWRYSRHPNYFGEILVWVGVYLFAFMQLSASERLIGLASPLVIVALLLFISGIPILEKSADKRWGKQAGYRAYKERTSLLIPLPPKTQ